MLRDRALRKTKVIATLGPACDDPDVLREMIGAGMNVARLNFSHDTHASHAARIERLRAASEELGVHLAVMLDTKGAEIRTGELAKEIELVPGAPFVLFVEPRPGDAEGVFVSHANLPREVSPGGRILIDDGHIELRVLACELDRVRCEVVQGGPLGSRKGVNVPDVALSVPSMDAANRADLAFAAEHAVDYIAASHVEAAAGIHEIRDVLAQHGARIPIIAKIESRRGVEKLEEIVDAADGAMVARGDLGVEMPVEQVPLIQKQIIRHTVMSGKPVVTATQMLDSMERNPRPTRAEASDVANAILDGTSAVMLSGETAKGMHPVESVRVMARVARRAEASLQDYGDLQQILPHPAHVVTEAVAQAAIAMAHHLDASAILTLTETGFTSRSISKYRPACPILAVTSSLEVVRRLSLNWGVTAVLYDGSADDDGVVDFLVERAVSRGWLAAGDTVVVTAGVYGRTGTTNLIRVVIVDEQPS